MKLNEIRELNQEAIAKQLETSRKELLDLRFKLATRQLVNHQDISRVKKDIARLETVRRDLALGIRKG